MGYHISKMTRIDPMIILRFFMCKYDKKFQKEVSQVVEKESPFAVAVIVWSANPFMS